MLILSNPRDTATVDNWPSGGNRVTATFTVEHKPRRGYRVSRVTTGKPKCTNYYLRATIVDGDDGRIYVLAYTEYGQIVVIPGTLVTNDYYYTTSPEYAGYKNLLLSP